MNQVVFCENITSFEKMFYFAGCLVCCQIFGATINFHKRGQVARNQSGVRNGHFDNNCTLTSQKIKLVEIFKNITLN